MSDSIKSLLIWICIVVLILFWLPMLALCRLFDRDPVRYRTGRLFRLLGKMMTRVNPGWRIRLEGLTDIDDRNPYIVVCNHLSNADIPVISNLPWEMKWVAKKELFDIPIVGWMMKLAGDISVNRRGK
ncbi:MAG: lysophospholipid acyltransferase family protein, partial [Balneolaceae bacterium]